MYANSGARERAFNLRNLFRGAQLRTLLLHKNTFSGVRESGGDVFLTLVFRSPYETFQKKLQKMFENEAQ